MDNTRLLWAKKSIDQTGELWLPLPVHMSDVADVAKLLWDEWIPDNVRNTIVLGILSDGEFVNPEVSRQLVAFLAFVHDVGKATPIFQDSPSRIPSSLDGTLRRGLEKAGFKFKNVYYGKKETRHALVSHVILTRNGLCESMAAIAGGHHGLPPSCEQILTLEEGSYNDECGFGDKVWKNTQDALVTQALVYSELTRDLATSITLDRKAQALISGLIIMADWIASDADKMPLFPIEEYRDVTNNRAAEAFAKLNLPCLWAPDWDLSNIYQRRFSSDKQRVIQPRPIQGALVNAVASCHKPGIFVIEAPMGEGKTEAALAGAELIANRIGCRGIYFALPSQATADAMFVRVTDWVKKFDHLGELFGVRLIHGKAELNELQSALQLSNNIEIFNDECGEDDNDDASMVVHEWLSGRKKGILSDFTVGTIDHVLMAALRQKHLVLRHLGLASKVVIIDECHAYDIYMESYLLMALRWLGAYGVPVIVLSATLPVSRRRSVIEAYLNINRIKKSTIPQREKSNAESKSSNTDLRTTEANIESRAYPLVTYTNGCEVRHLDVRGAVRRKEVKFLRIADEQVIDILKTVLDKSGVAGIIVNTVKRAQNIYSRLVSVFGKDVCLLHSQILASDRTKREKTLVLKLGPDVAETERPDRLIVVGTQVLEQSLDIDFDIMFTDLCPMDLLLQRVGRLHRHFRRRLPQHMNATCYVMCSEWGGFDRDAEFIYGSYLLMRTRAALPNRVVLPMDIPRLVAEVYDETEATRIPDDMTNDFKAAKETWTVRTDMLIGRARAFQVTSPYLKKSLLGWLDTTASDAQGDAAVRDGPDSLEVITIQRSGEGLFLLTATKHGEALPLTKPDDELARTLLGCSIRLPAMFGEDWIIDKVIKELEEVMTTEGLTEGWYQSHLLKGMLVMVLDENKEIILFGHRLRYDKELGLCRDALR